MKHCKYCAKEIDPQARICPYCRKETGVGLSYHLGTILMAAGILALVGALFIDPLTCGATGIILLIIGYFVRKG